MKFTRFGRAARSVAWDQKRAFSSNSSSPLFVIDEEVQDAIRNCQPIVALESTIIAHGMSYPHNLHLSQRLSTIFRNKNVVPATIAIKNNQCHIGLSKVDMEDLARSGQEGRATKCSTRELSLVLAKHQHLPPPPLQSFPHNQWGATTVAATMRLAHLAGISTFVTGGIGGVHRDGENTMDVSTDLMELSRTPVVVVSAGIKSILDIQRTLEVLETYGVPVISYQCDEFPAFFSPNSGIKTPERMNDVNEIASAYMMAQELNLSHGFLVGVPNTDPAGEHVEEAIQAALVQAKEQGITGRDITPFILKNVAMATMGDSLRSNMALVERNASVGADIAIAIAQRKRKQNFPQPPIHPRVRQQKSVTSVTPKSRVIVLGGIVLDIVARPIDGQSLTLGTSNPASCIESDGGVGRNIAETLCRLGSEPLLYSAVGNDTRGKSMLRRLHDDCGILSLEHTVQTIPNSNTATYIAILNEHRDLHTACADMEVFNHVVPPPLEVLNQAEYIIMDANPPIQVLQQVARDAVHAGVKIFLEPTSVPKTKLLCADEGHFLSFVTFASPNLDELYAMACVERTFVSIETLNEDFIRSNIYPIATTVVKQMRQNEAHLIITCGAHGVILVSKTSKLSDITFQRFFAPNDLEVQNATGAGDTLSGAFVHALLGGKSIPECIAFGMEAAVLSLQCSNKAISPLLSEMKSR
jgi:pseudouridine-5'-phosphate glycosidase/sugar/nucleoside kinase (ribokinase family)